MGGRLVRGLLRGCGLVVTLAVLVAATRFLWPQPGTDEQPAGTWRQLSFLRSALDDGAGESAQTQFPEGYFFAHALYGLAWVQAGASAEHREEALREARWALDRLESDRGRAPFSARLQPAYGVFWAGWTNWLRGGVVSLSGASDAEEVRRFGETSAEIAAAFTGSTKTPFLQAYPGQAWPVDSTVAIASLRLHDHLLTPRFDSVTRSWLDAVKARLDPDTGLVPHRVSADEGRLLEGARATSLAVIDRFLPDIDTEFARAQYAGFRDRFLSYPAGFGPAVREYPEGNQGSGDIDSGPLVAGISLSSTVVALGTARVNGDGSLAAALGSEGELLGLPITLPGSKRYAFGLLPIGDAFVAWSATARPFTTAPLTPMESGVRWWWRLPWLVLLLLGGFAPWSIPLIRRFRARPDGRRPLARPGAPSRPSPIG
ncbi:hypothetical protein [Nocardia inohanensis]|uniref:hypothetical protein n=1 Tax=Nocardia inohanensis TaxID=209246 RepID=UPI00082BA2FC|nr:hypothetical protein [Nocardia inohanensis]